MAVAVCVAFACAAGAVASHARANALRTEGDWLMARGNAEAQEYASTFDGARAEAQLHLFDQRRQVLKHSTAWWLFEMLMVLGAVIACISSYVLYLFRRLRDQLVDGSDESSTPEGAPEALSAALPRS